MIDFKKVRPCTNPYVDGTLDDGRLVEFKLKIPNSMDVLMHLIVAMANTNGGIIIFGVDERTMLYSAAASGDVSHPALFSTALTFMDLFTATGPLYSMPETAGSEPSIV